MAITEIETEEKLSDSGDERGLLSCVFKSVEAWLEVSDTLSSEDFTNPMTQSLWAIIDNMRNKGIEPDHMEVYEKLPENARAMVDKFGGWNFLQALGNLPAKPSNATHYAQRLRELTVLRRGREAGKEISVKAESGLTANKFMEEAEMLVNDIPGNVGDNVVDLGSIAYDFLKSKIANPAEIPGLSTGYELLDLELQGLQPGRMYVVGARKKTGKSILLLNIMKHMAIDRGIPILYISTEQTQTDEVSRMLSMVSGVPEHYINNGTFAKMTDDSPERVFAAQERLKDAPIKFAYDPFFSLSKLRRTIKKHRVLSNIQCVFFDYIKIPTDAMGGRDKWAQVGDLAYGLKAVAGDQNLPVVTAVQVNRDGAEQMKFTGDIDSDSFANSDMIAQAMSVGMILRPLNADEKKAYEFADEPKRILKITDNRHGASSYKALFNFKADIITLEERKIVA